MKMKDVLLESAKTLYHGTLIELIPSIKNIGLVPSVGEFTTTMYDEYIEHGVEMEELVFATDKAGLQKAVNAIFGAMKSKGYDDKDFFKHAALAVIKDGDDTFDHADSSGEYENYSAQIEPDDYYHYGTVGVDFFITGKKLENFLRRHKIDFTQYLGFYTDEEERKQKERLVIKAVIKKGDQQRTVDEVISLVRALSKKDLDHYYTKAKRLGLK